MCWGRAQGERARAISRGGGRAVLHVNVWSLLVANVRVDVVVVNWNAGVQLLQCIESLRAHGGSALGRVVVIDNGSSDGSLDQLDEGESVKILRMGSNLGFARACNIGFKETSSEYVLFFNPDAILFPGTLDGSLRCLEAIDNADVAVLGVQLVDASGSVQQSCAKFPTATGILVQSFGLDRIFPSFSHFMREWDHGDTRTVDQVIGAYFLVRRRAFESVGGFDERFFVYYEELDFSLRAKLAGWRSLYCADVKAYHAGGGTSNQIKARRLFYALRSRLLYVQKHFSTVDACLALFATLGVEPFSRLVHALIGGSLEGVKETFRAYAMLGRWIVEMTLDGFRRHRNIQMKS